MSGGGETGAVMGEVELGDQAAGEQSGVEVGQEAVGAGEQVSGEALAVACAWTAVRTCPIRKTAVLWPWTSPIAAVVAVGVWMRS